MVLSLLNAESRLLTPKCASPHPMINSLWIFQSTKTEITEEDRYSDAGWRWLSLKVLTSARIFFYSPDEANSVSWMQNHISGMGNQDARFSQFRASQVNGKELKVEKKRSSSADWWTHSESLHCISPAWWSSSFQILSCIIAVNVTHPGVCIRFFIIVSNIDLVNCFIGADDLLFPARIHCCDHVLMILRVPDCTLVV